MQKGKKFLSDLKLYSDYFKWREEIGRYENWEEACADIINGHRKKYSNVNIEEYISSALESMEDQAVLASQRNLQFRHDEIMRHNTRMYNCTSTHIMRNRVFQEIFYLGLSGCGVGGGLLIPFVNNISRIQKRVLGTKTFVIPDTIEGWADSLGVLLSSYFADNQPFPEYAGYEVKFDYSLIREKGTFISGGFKAPGPDGLKQSLEKIEQLIEKWLDKEGNKIRPILAFDIICHASDAVLSGGVRRSALNMIVDPNDDEMIHAKTGNWRIENPQRARSNNSVLLLRGKVTKEQFDYLVKLNDGANDIGFVFANSWFDMFNPCVSDDTLIHTPNGLFRPSQLLNNDKIVLNGQTFNSKGFRMTGIKPLYEFETNFGRKIKVTGEHLMFTKDGMIPASELKLGDTLIISNNSNNKFNTTINNDFKKGYLVGSLIGDGNFSKEYCQLKFWGEDNHVYHNKMLEFLKDLNWSSKKKESLILTEEKEGYTTINSKELYDFIISKDSSVIEHKRLTKKLLEGSFDYINGIVSGYFDADGTVLFNKEKGNSVRIVSTELENLENLQIVLNSFGVYSKIYKFRNKSLNGKNVLPDGKGGMKEYDVQNSHELVITKESILNFSHLGFINNSKRQKIDLILSTYKRNFNKTKYQEDIVNITYITKSEEVYDCEVETGIESFECNGFHVHNCFEILKIPVLDSVDYSKIDYENVEHYVKINKDKFGIQGCNLSEINAEKCTTKEKFFKACKDATILGTLQAGYNNFPYLGETSEKIFAREALLGVSITGWMNNPMLFNAELLKEGAEVVKRTNKELAEVIGINQAARTTCVKPSGNASVVLGTASGIHPEHSEKYFRIMQLNKESNTAKWLTENMSFLLEDSVWSTTKSDYVVFVPVENPKKGLFKKDMKGIKHLELIKLVQQNWVNAGTNPEKCVYNPINHNTSCTVIIDDKDAIVDYIWDNKDEFTAVSFMSDYGDKDFNQAPFTSVLNLEELVEEYGKGAVLASGLVVDGLHYFDNNLWSACDTLLENLPVTGTREQVLLRKYWLDRAKKFAKNYFKNDMRRMVYCLKDVHLFHKWETVTRQFKEVSFGEILDKPQYKDIADYGAVACSGPNGSCEITRI
jgi:intein/homing endonuclease